MIARHEEKRHLQLVCYIADFIPPLLKQRSVIRGAFDQIAHGDDELGPEHVEFMDGISEDAGTMTCGTVGDDGKVKILRVILETKMVPGLSFGSNVMLKDRVFVGRLMSGWPKRQRLRSENCVVKISVA